MIKLPHVAGRIFGEPLAIEPGKLDVIVSAIGPRLRGYYDDDADSGDDAAPQPSTYQVTSDGIAQIDICGTLVSKSSGMNALSGLTSYADISRQFSAAVADQNVRGIALMVNSPGGEVTGMLDLADAMYGARGQKPVVAIVDCAASAAYCLASAADQIVVTRTALVGSIGVIALHLDQSEADAKAGLKYTAIFAGDRKDDGNPHEPLSPEAKASLQGRIDQVYGMFTTAVARNRSMTDAKVRGTQAAVYMGQDGVNAGLADSVGTVDDASAMLRRAISSGSKSIFAVHVAPATNSQQEHHMTAEELAAQNTAVIEAAKLQAGKDAHANAALITDICALAGKPDLASGYLASGKSVADIRAELMKAKADEQAKTALDSSVLLKSEKSKLGGEESYGKASPWESIMASVTGQKETR
jgi:signal peptide peptidase SppA